MIDGDVEKNRLEHSIWGSEGKTVNETNAVADVFLSSEKPSVMEKLFFLIRQFEFVWINLNEEKPEKRKRKTVRIRQKGKEKLNRTNVTFLLKPPNGKNNFSHLQIFFLFI